MKKSVIITGATGMVGKGVLLQCLDDDRIEKVVVVGRNSVGFTHSKMDEVIHKNFTDLSAIASKFEVMGAIFFCLGISAAGLKEAAYKTITYDYALAFANLLLKVNPNGTFIYVSGVGTDSSEGGKLMWARVKGATENAILRLGLAQAYMFRPGLIIPLRGIRSKTKLYQFFYDHLMRLIKGIKKLAPQSVVDTTQIGRAMIHSLINGYPQSIIHSKDILLLSVVA